MMIPSKITSNRLTFKPVSLSDLDIFYDAFMESFKNLSSYYIPAWSKYESCPPKNEMKKFLERTEKEFYKKEGFLFSVFDKKNNFIGQAELHHVDFSVPKARLGYWVRDSRNKNNYATEMANALTRFGFDVLNCVRLEIRNDIRNPASGKIAKKLRYKFLTIFEKNKVGKPNDYWNLEIYARLNKDELPDLDIEYFYDQS